MKVRRKQSEIKSKERGQSPCHRCVQNHPLSYDRSTQTKVQTPLATPITTTAPIPHRALISPTRGTAPLLDPVPEGELFEGDDPPLAGAVGVNMDCALARQDEAAALAAAVSEGAVLLSVALPAKLQDWGLRLVAW
jgi:hypothetical protein